MTVERHRKHQEARTEAEIGRTRVVRAVKNSGEFWERKNVAVAVSEIMHLRNARNVLNVGVQIITNEIARI